MFTSRTFLQASRRAAVAPRAFAIRSYATPAAADVKPPVALYGLDGTYASALVRGYLVSQGVRT